MRERPARLASASPGGLLQDVGSLHPVVTHDVAGRRADAQCAGAAAPRAIPSPVTVCVPAKTYRSAPSCGTETRVRTSSSERLKRLRCSSTYAARTRACSAHGAFRAASARNRSGEAAGYPSITTGAAGPSLRTSASS